MHSFFSIYICKWIWSTVIEPYENNHIRNLFNISLFYTNVKSPGNGSVTRIKTEQTYTERKQCSGLVAFSTNYHFQYTAPCVRENSQSQQPNSTLRRGAWGATDHNTSWSFPQEQ